MLVALETFPSQQVEVQLFSAFEDQFGLKLGFTMFHQTFIHADLHQMEASPFKSRTDFGGWF